MNVNVLVSGVEWRQKERDNLLIYRKLSVTVFPFLSKHVQDHDY